MQFWVIQTLNSLALGGLLFLLSSGFSLIFGLMRIANLTHGALFMLGAYLGVSILNFVPNLWAAAVLGGIAVAAFGGLIERLVLRRLAGNVLGQVLVTLGISFIPVQLGGVVRAIAPRWIPTVLRVSTPALRATWPAIAAVTARAAAARAWLIAAGGATGVVLKRFARTGGLPCWFNPVLRPSLRSLITGEVR